MLFPTALTRRVSSAKSRLSPFAAHFLTPTSLEWQTTGLQTDSQPSSSASVRSPCLPSPSRADHSPSSSSARSKAQTADLQEGEQDLVQPFAPTFVYPIFGEEEKIFGYKGLEIDVRPLPPLSILPWWRADTPHATQYRFASGSLSSYLKISYDSKFPETTTVKPDDPEKVLYEFIPPDYAKNLDEFEATVEKDAGTFRPLGTKVGAYRMKEEDGEECGANGKGKDKGKGKSNGGPVLPERQWEVLHEGEGEEDEDTYEAYWSNWDTPGFKEYHRRMQIFVLLYIEGASYIDEEDGRWEFVTLYVPFLFSLLPLPRGSLLWTGAYSRGYTVSNDESEAARSRTTSQATSRSIRSSAGRTRSDCDLRTSPSFSLSSPAPH